MVIYDYLSFIPKNINPKNSAKIYFAGEKEDFELYFEGISNSILEFTRKSGTTCTIWHRDFDKQPPEDFGNLLSSFLQDMHLLVVPVTRTLFLKEGGVMQQEVTFAKENKKPILPIMLEEGLLELYSKPENFGNIQFLNPFEKDNTAISYDKKLTDFLGSVLVNDKTREQVQKAFDAYIFLSYRKKDRALAQSLMKLIHQNEFCRDIAIWYDEYLVPGEDFNNTIKEALLKSNLFALMVTPSVIEKGNYIIEHEYPLAKEMQRKNGKPILPIESVDTDRAELEKLYEDIPECAKQSQESLLFDLLIGSLRNIALMQNKNDPVHNYFIGLAYLNGIDVEIDYKKAHELIISAAESGVVEAKKKLVSIYSAGIGTHIDYKKALYWSEQIIEQYKKENRKDKDYNRNLAKAYSNQVYVLIAMNDVAAAEEPAKNAIAYAKKLEAEECLSISVAMYLFLSDAKKDIAAKGMKGILTPNKMIKLFKAGVDPLLKAERLLDSYKNKIPEESYDKMRLFIYNILYPTYWNIKDKTKGEAYFKKAYELTKKRHPEQLTDLEMTRKLQVLQSTVNYNDINTVLPMFDMIFSYFNTANIKNIGYILPTFMSFMTFLSIALTVDENNGDIEKFKPYIKKSYDIMQQIPITKLNSNILSQQYKLYQNLYIIAESKEAYEDAYTICTKMVQVAKEMLLRNECDETKSQYYMCYYEAASACFKAGDIDKASGLAQKAYNLTFDNPLQDKQNSFKDKLKIILLLIDIHIDKEESEYTEKAFDYAEGVASLLYKYYYDKEAVSALMNVLHKRLTYELKKSNFEAALTLALRCHKANSNFIKYKKELKEKKIPYERDFNDALMFEINKFAVFSIIMCYIELDTSEKADIYCDFLLILTDESEIEDISYILCANYVKALNAAKKEDFTAALGFAEAFLKYSSSSENDYLDEMLVLLRAINEKQPSEKGEAILKELENFQ